ncbi:MAG: hypothetical protein D3916_06265 [Candidatus Electrothrix sp. MAN1_4]|nr:hypothetical protein [Candidatus Electrothrix sp. MAN1_4]
MRKYTAAILFTGCYMLATAHVTMAEEAPNVQIDMAKINQALNQQATPGNGTAGQMSAKTAASTMQNMQRKSATTGTMGSTGTTRTTENATQPMPAQQVLDGSMRDALISSDVMAEVQQKVMAENMKVIQKSMQESIMKNMMGSMQGSVQGSVVK